jgi:hypothetical protein
LKLDKNIKNVIYCVYILNIEKTIQNGEKQKRLEIMNVRKTSTTMTLIIKKSKKKSIGKIYRMKEAN